MARKHAFFIVVLLAAAALAGFVAFTRTADLAQPAAATATPGRSRAVRAGSAAPRPRPLRGEAPQAAGVEAARRARQQPATVITRVAAAPAPPPRTTTTTSTRTSTRRTMTSHVARLYALAASILALFLAWAGVAAAPWQAEKPRPRPRPRTRPQRRSPSTSSASGRTPRSSSGSSSDGTASSKRWRPLPRANRHGAARRDDEDVMSRHAFRAMGTAVELHLDAETADAALLAAEAEFRAPGSAALPLPAGLGALAPQPRGELAAGPDLLAVVDAALDARELTAGRFDPTVHDALVAAGYDRSFELVAAGNGTPSASRQLWRRRVRSTARPATSRSTPASSSTSAGSPRATPSTARSRSWPPPARPRGRRRGYRASPASRGPSVSRPPPGRSRSS